MYALAFTLLAIAPAQPPAKHEDQNPLYKGLLDPGLDVGGDAKVKLPAPAMPDGLDGAKQTAIIKNLIGTQYSYDEFTRKSVVAPQLLKIRDIAPPAPKSPTRGVDVYFIAHGDFKLLEEDKFLDKLVGSNRGGGKGGPLTNADLAKRNIVLPKDNEKREGYGHVEFDFLEKVRLHATGHAMWSRGTGLRGGGGGDRRAVPERQGVPEPVAVDHEGRRPGDGGQCEPVERGRYVLQDHQADGTAGALFVEQHIIFTEPIGWFGGRTCCARSSRSWCRTTSAPCARSSRRSDRGCPTLFAPRDRDREAERGLLPAGGNRPLHGRDVNAGALAHHFHGRVRTVVRHISSHGRVPPLVYEAAHLDELLFLDRLG